MVEMIAFHLIVKLPIVMQSQIKKKKKKGLNSENMLVSNTSYMSI